MRLKDIHTNLKKEINLLKFFPKKEIGVDSFCDEKKVILDISKKNEFNTIKIKRNKNIKISNLSKNNFNLDVLKKKSFIKNDINLNKDKKQKKINLLYFLKNNFNINKLKILLFYKGDIFRFLSKKIILIFIIILIIFLDKIAVEHFTNSGYKKLVQLKNTQYSTKLIESSNLDFVISNVLFKPFTIFGGSRINDADNAIVGGLKITNLLLELDKFKNGTYKLIEQKGAGNIMFSQLLLNNKNIFKYTEREIRKIKEIYNNIKFSNNQDLKNKLDIFKIKLNEIDFYVHTINSNFDTFLNILGHKKRKKYLIVFQNNDEIRPHGGFMGSMGILEIFRGQIKKFEKKDIYDYEFKIKKENFKRELSPKGLNKLTPYLGLRDSNYFINDKDSGKKIKFFMKKAGYDIDGIIYINQNTLLKILDLIGKYHSKILNTEINSKNFSLIMSSLVESKKSKFGTLGTPKKVLFDFMEEFQTVLKNKNINNLDLLKIFIEDIKNREISFYNFNKSEKFLLKQLGLYNPIEYNNSLDFSYPVFTSISGNKSDRYIKTSYKKIVKKLENCSYKTSFEINLEHTFNKKEEEKILKIFNKFGIKKDSSKLLYIQGKGENKQYVRIIVPKNAIIKPNKNITVTPYYKIGKSIDFFLNTKVGKKSHFNIEYILPNKNCQIYSYKLYKQPGIKKFNFKIDNLGNNQFFENQRKDIYIN